MLKKINLNKNFFFKDIYDLFLISIIRIIPIILNILIVKYFLTYHKSQIDEYIALITTATIICTFSNYGILNYILKFKDRNKFKILGLFIKIKIPMVFFLIFICAIVTTINYYFSELLNEGNLIYILTFFLVIFLFGINNLNSFYFNAINKAKTAGLFRFLIIGLIFYILLSTTKNDFMFNYFYASIISVIISYIYILKSINLKNIKINHKLRFYNFLISNKHKGLSSIFSSWMLYLPLVLATYIYNENEIFIFFFVTRILNLFFISTVIFENKFMYQYSRYFVEKNFSKIKKFLIYRTKLIMVPLIPLSLGLIVFKEPIFNYFEIESLYSNLYFFTIIVGILKLIIGPVIEYTLFYDIKFYYKKMQYIMYFIYYSLCFLFIFTLNISLAIYFISTLFILYFFVISIVIYLKMKKFIYNN